MKEMKLYIFECNNGVKVYKEAESMKEAIAWFKRTYPPISYSCVYEK